MKKNSKRQIRDYENKYSACTLAYYGILMKDGRARIDTKRFKKFFSLPDSKIEHRKTVYYIPTKIHKFDYFCNLFESKIIYLKDLWCDEFSNAIESLKTPKEVEEKSRTEALMNGVLEFEEASVVGIISGVKRQISYNFIVKSLYAQFFQQAMSEIDAFFLKVISQSGYQNDKFTRKLFDKFIQRKQKGNVKSFKDYDNYKVYDRAYCVWNFLKHNSISAYDTLKKAYPEMIYDPKNKYENVNIAIIVLKINERFMLKTLDDLPKFFNEICQSAFDENVLEASWDYDDYFIEKAKNKIDTIENPLGLSKFI